MTPRRLALWCVFVYFVGAFVLGAVIDYAISAACLVPPPQGPPCSPVQLWLQGLHVPYRLLVFLMGLLVFQYSGVLPLGVVSFGFFALSILALFWLKLYQGKRQAFVTSSLLYGGGALFLFELGVMLFDPSELFTHVTDFMGRVGLSFVSNALVLAASLILFSVGVFVRLRH